VDFERLTPNLTIREKQKKFMSKSEVELIEYRLSFNDLKSHLVDVEVSIPTEYMALGRENLKLMMPVWTPGSYLIREYARQVERIDAFDAATNEKLSITKVSKNQWTVSTLGCKKVVVNYQIYCREQSVRTNWIDLDYGFLTGAATFITVDDNCKRPHRVVISPPDSWPSIACSLPVYHDQVFSEDLDVTSALREKFSGAIDSEGNLDLSIASTLCFDRYANSFDELVDSPILMGDLIVRHFEVNGFPHYFASYGTAGAWDTDLAVKDLSLIVAQAHRFWGEIPYQHYWFLNIAVDAYGGLEHDDCTVLMARRNAMKRRETYVEWLGLASHEFFHTWNVRRLRPKALTNYDYHHEQYTPELWIAEGITSYYDDLLLIHAGMISESEYMDQLGKTIRAVEDSPGHLVQSLYESSYDTWIKHYRPDENTPNGRISYYTKGAVVAFFLDQLIREQTSNRRSLDDVMRRMWRDFRVTGYQLRDFEKTVSDLLGDSVDPWFQEHVYQAGKLDYSEPLNRLGLKLDVVSSSGGNAGNIPELVSPEIDFGVDLISRDGRWIVSKVYRGGAGWEAGLQVDDELIATAGYRLPVSGLREQLNEFRENQTISITISRRGKILDRTIACRIKKSVKLQSLANPLQNQLDNRRRWLGMGTLDLTRFT